MPVLVRVFRGLHSVWRTACCSLLFCCITVPILADEGPPPTAVGKLPDPFAEGLGYSSQYVRVNDLDFHYVERGKGDVILFLHGYPFFWYAWHNMMQRFAPTHRVIAVDNRGYNLSDKPEEPHDYHISKLVDDVAKQIRILAPDTTVTLVGHDWGGTLAWSVAKRHPELLKQVVVINAPPLNTLLDAIQNNAQQRRASGYIEILKSGGVEERFAEQGGEMLWNYGFNRRFATGEMNQFDKEAYFRAWGKKGAMQSALHWYRANIPSVNDIEDKHYWPTNDARIRVPSLLIWTEGERVFVPEIKALTNLIADDLKIVTLDGSGHAPFLDKPFEVESVMRNFMSSSATRHSEQ